MTSLSFDAITGTGTMDNRETRKFLEAWYELGDTVLITAISHDGAGPRSLSQAVPAARLWSLTNEDLEGMGDLDGRKYNIFMGVNSLKADHSVEMYTRGGKKDVDRINGLAIDFDVKTGCFDSREQIFEFIEGLDIQPTLTVSNGGSGGVHAYWKLQYGETASEDLLVRWWAYIQEKAGDRAIDRLIDTSRLMRLPGSIYWPKTGGLIGSVTVANVSGLRYSVKELEEATAQAYAAMNTRKRETRTAAMTGRETAADLLHAYSQGNGGTWTKRLALHALEQAVEKLDWHDILTPVGWTNIRTQSDGVRLWARPNQSGKSASTDYEGGSVMSLHSWSESTGLADLKEAGIPLTKLTVLLRLGYQDDVSRMVQDLASVI